MFIKKSGDGRFYLYKKTRGAHRKYNSIRSNSNIFLVKSATEGRTGKIASNVSINLPKGLIGKRVMLRLIILKE